MAEDDKEQRSEEATDKRRREARERGRVAHSKELNSTFVMLGSMAILYIYGLRLNETMMLSWKEFFHMAADFRLDMSNASDLLLESLKLTGLIVGPVMLVISLSGIISNLLQNGGLLFTLTPLTPELSKLDPIKGFSKFVSKSAAAELVKSLLKIGVIGYVAYLAIEPEWNKIPQTAMLSVPQMMEFLGWTTMKIMFYVTLVMLVIAAADYGFQRYIFEESLKMTKQEVKDERKDIEGNPVVKQRIRQIQYDIARKRMMAEVPKAEVVITNPTHLAIALGYDRTKHGAPVVLAKGAGFVAEKIKEIAKQHSIPTVENKPLARVLYKTVDIGKLIPIELYKAVAEILAYVYRLKGKRF